MKTLDIKNMGVDDRVYQINDIMPSVHFNMLMVGKSFSGKSNLIKNLITRKDMYKGVFKNKHIFYFTLSPSQTVYSIKGINIYNSTKTENGLDIIQTLFDTQKETRERGDKLENLLIIFDDFVTDSVFDKRRGLLTKLYCMGRNYNISVIVTSQEYNLIPKVLRDTSRFMILWKMGGKARENIIRDNTDLCYNNEDEFARDYDLAVKDKFNFMYIDKTKCAFYHNFTTLLRKL